MSLFAKCRRVQPVLGWLRWLDTSGEPDFVQRVRSLMPEGVPVVVVYNSALIRESIFYLDDARVPDAKVLATMKVMFWSRDPMIIEAYGQMIARSRREGRSGASVDYMLNSPLRVQVNDKRVLGLELC